MCRPAPRLVGTRLQQGFTLMEVLIAVSITAVIGLGVWQVMSGVIMSRDRVDEVAEEFEGLQKAFLLLERDLRQVLNRPVRNIYGDYEPALTSQGEEFELMVTHQGWRNPLGKQRSELQRSAWEYTGDELRRRYWAMLDQPQEEDSRDQLLLSDVTAFDIRFLDEDRTWQDSWPPPNQSIPSGPGAPVIPLPMAVEVSLDHVRFGEVSRLFLMPDFDVTEVQTSIIRSGQQGDEEDSEDDEDQGGQGGGS
ncbi:type II secretion system minor pseudopilin GspJ [Marinobacter zhanjiangensis]|nr:type II secretion system minor pseudopilin GspJ [Marinobacter zhanjiangensis]